MFERATKKLVRQIDPDGALIASSSLNDSEKLQLLAVVLKKQKGWFWQQTIYRPTSFSLNDLLEGDQIKPEREEKEFVKYKGMYKNQLSGSVEVGNTALGLNANGQVRSKLCLSLGTLKKEDLTLQKLLKDSRGRKLDLSHPLIQQSLKRNKVFTLLTERIFTTCDCSISYAGQEQGSCYSGFGAYSEICVQESGEVQNNSVVAMEIPPGTVMAYSVIEMSISSDGYFELCVAPGGIEADDTSQNASFSVVDGAWPLQEIQEGSSLSSLKGALSEVQTKFFALADLSPECRSSLLLILRNILLDRPVLSALVDRLEVLSCGEAPLHCKNELTDKHSHLLGAFLDLLECEPANRSEITTASVAVSNQTGSQISEANHSGFPLESKLNGSSPGEEKQNGCHTAVSHQNGTSTKASKQQEQLLIAMHMLLSALEELTDAGLKMLEHFCSSEGLKSLQDLVTLLIADSKTLSIDSMSAYLQKDEELYRVQDLFKSCNVLLRREDHLMFAEVTCEEGFLPLVLCITINGLQRLNGA